MFVRRPHRLFGLDRPVRLFLGVIMLATLLGGTAAWATGFRPFPQPDTATVVRGGSVSVLASGATSVLANDADLEGDPLVASIVLDVTQGTLTLNSDGTFLYVHNGGTATVDQFFYRAFDGTSFSTVTTVRININEPIPPRITGQRNITTNEDQPRSITLEELVIEGGSGDFQLFVDEGENYSVRGTTIVPATNFNGTLNPPVRVSDQNFSSNTFVLDVVVQPVNDSPFVVNPVPDQVGEEDEFFELALAQNFDDVESGGDLTFTARGLPPSGSLALNRSTGVLSGTPQLADAQDLPFEVTITAEDIGGATASLSFLLTIVPRDRADLELSLTVQPSPAIIGDTPVWEIRVENLGLAPMDQGLLAAAWFSSEAPITLSPPGSGCTIVSNDTQQPELTCPLSGLPPLDSISFLVQSAHQVPGDTQLTARVTTDDELQLDNNVAALSANLAASFSEGPVQNLIVSASDVASGDLNGDGYTDLVVAAQDLQVYFNTGERQLGTQALTLGPGGEGANVVLIDWNVDGAVDVAIAHADTRAGQLYINDGSGIFPQSVPLPVTNISSMVSADLNGDGQSELIVSGVGGTEQIRNDGQGQPEVAFVNATIARDLSTGDLDLNSLPDLVLTDAETRAIYILLNIDGDTFTESTLEAGSVASVNLDDIDGDGAPDLLLAIDGADLEIPANLVLRNQLDGSFVDWARVGASPTTELFSGDVTGDGVVDLITINETGVHQVYLGDSLGGFVLDEQQILGPSALRGHLVDINSDLSLDLILAGGAADNVGIHANNGRGRFGLGDRIAPSVALLGNSNVRIDVGAAFQDPGATATDDIDGDVTGGIVVDNPVNPSLVGSYSVTYTVADRAGNLGLAVRTVQVGNEAQGGGGGGATGSLSIALLVGFLAWRRVYFKKG